MSKRPVRDDDSVEALHPAKLTRRMSELRLAAPDPGLQGPDAAEADGDGEMDGVEARDFVFLNKKDMLDALNGVEIDDRFMKIPASVAATAKSVPYFERPTQALIPYQAGPNNNDDAMDEDDAMRN